MTKETTFLTGLGWLVLTHLPAALGAHPLDDLPPRTWYEVPGSHLEEVFPPPHPGWGNTGPASVMDAWCGGAFDTTRDRLIVWGGGHGDYGGNEIYLFDVESLQWVRHTEPSQAAQTCLRYYSDGSPAPKHTYNGVTYVPTTDSFWAGDAGCWCADASGCVGPEHLNLFDFTAHAWLRATSPVLGGYGTGSVTAFDPITNSVWLHQKGSNARLARYDVATDTWSEHSTECCGGWFEYYTTMDIDPGRRLLVTAGADRIFAWDLADPAIPHFVPATSGDKTIEAADSPGFAFDSASRLFVGWSGGATVYTLDPETWAWTAVPPAPSNTVVPTDPNANGTFGRFRYVPSRDLFVLANRTNDNVYFYRLSAGTGGEAPTPPRGLTVIE